MTPQRESLIDTAAPLSIVLGTNEIASAIAVRLKRAGHGVLMCHDAALPVIRRGMAFYDAVFGDATTIAGVAGVVADSAAAVRTACHKPNYVVVSPLDFTELLVLNPFRVLVDARMHKRGPRPDLRHLARRTVGVGPGFDVGINCDIAIETKPARVGVVTVSGRTEAADGISRKLGGAGRERFVYSEAAGPWRTALEIGMRVFKGFPVGRVGPVPVFAPIDGILRGIARDGIEVPQSVKVVEVDPRGRRAAWIGIDQRGRVIADATLEAVQRLDASSVQMHSLSAAGPK